MAKVVKIKDPAIKEAYMALSQALKDSERKKALLSDADVKRADFLYLFLKQNFRGNQKIKDLALLGTNGEVVRQILFSY
jgi:hypothetical protein